MDADGSNAHRLTSVDDGHPAWSPDGNQIAFERGNSLYVMNADGSNVRNITNGGLDYEPAWSPDGKRIAFASQRGSQWQIYTVNADGSNLKRVSPMAGGFKLEPMWSADGRRIAYLAREDNTSTVREVAADGSEIETTLFALGPWVAGVASAADNSRFVVARGVSDEDGGGFTGFVVDIVNRDGSLATRSLTTIMPKSTNDRPAWTQTKP
jgi:dipeptidyl aminopeptidase/acylaminoacyl peptidase